MTELQPIIRAATDADMVAVHSIYAHYVLGSIASFEFDPPSVSDMAARRQAILSSSLPYLVAVDPRTSTVCGYAYAAVYRPRVGYRFTIESTVYVDHACRRRGVGTALMRVLLVECASKGYKQMLAFIASGHESAAGSLALHTRLGFHSVGVLRGVGHKFDQWLDTTIFQITLDDAQAADDDAYKQ